MATPQRLRCGLVLCVLVGFGVSGGTLVYSGIAPEYSPVLPAEWTLGFRIADITIGLACVGAPIYTLIIQRKRFEDASPENSPIVALVLGIALLALAIFDTPGLELPWRDYVWMLPAFALGWIAVGLLIIFDRRFASAWWTKRSRDEW